MDDACTRWSDLPPELWRAIGQHFDSYIDVLRCRGVCRSLRASFPSFDAVFPFLPLHVPSPDLDGYAGYPVKYSLLVRKITYRLSSLNHNQTTNAIPSSAAKVAKVWFAMAENAKEGKLRFKRPLYLSNKLKSYEAILDEIAYEALPDKMNLLDFRIQELAKSYMVLSTNGVYDSRIIKAVMFPDSPWIDTKNCIVLAIFVDGELGLARLGDDKWTMIVEHNFARGDVLVHKGQFYAVDRQGEVFSIDTSSIELSQISPPICGYGRPKYLVECGGQVYVVDRFGYYSDGEDDDSDDSDREEEEEVTFKVYKVDLNGEYCRRKLEVGRMNFEKKTLILGSRRESSFSISASEFEGIREHCIYYPRNVTMPRPTPMSMLHLQLLLALYIIVLLIWVSFLSLVF